MEFEILDILNKNGFESYIVGGYVRDSYLNKKTTDVDITTSAKVCDLKKLFDVVSEKYSSVKINYKEKIYEITTYRKEFFYVKHRYPFAVLFTKNVKKDLKRRDFTINALLMDRNKNIIDYVNGCNDLDNHIIRMIGRTSRIKQDSLRILRAIRLATTLNFKIDKSLEYYIKKYGYLISYLSSDRIKYELDKMFESDNLLYGISLIKNYNLNKYLKLGNIDNIVFIPNLNYIWAQVDCCNYNFKKGDLKEINRIKKALDKDIDSYLVYKYGVDMCKNICKLKSIDENIISDIYDSLVIKNRKDIKYDLSLLNKELVEKIEYLIVTLKIDNNEKSIKKYINQ